MPVTPTTRAAHFSCWHILQLLGAGSASKYCWRNQIAVFIHTIHDRRLPPSEKEARTSMFVRPLGQYRNSCCPFLLTPGRCTTVAAPIYSRVPLSTPSTPSVAQPVVFTRGLGLRAAHLTPSPWCCALHVVSGVAQCGGSFRTCKRAHQRAQGEQLPPAPGASADWLASKIAIGDWLQSPYGLSDAPERSRRGKIKD